MTQRMMYGVATQCQFTYRSNPMSEKREREYRQSKEENESGPFKFEQGEMLCRYNNFEPCKGPVCAAFIELPIQNQKEGVKGVIGVCSDKAIAGITLELAQHVAQIRFALTAKVVPAGPPMRIFPAGRG